MGLIPVEALIEAAMPRGHSVLKDLSGLLCENPYFAGDALSRADLHLAPQVEFFTHTPEWKVLGEPYPNLVAWLGRMEARPSMQATTGERAGQMALAA